MRGTLQDISLLEVIRLLALQPGFQGKITVALDNRKEGQVFLADGQVVGAFAPGEAGITALSSLLHAKGAFETELGAVGETDRNIQNLWVERLLQFSQQRANFWKIIRQRIPSLDLIASPNLAVRDPVMATFLPKHWQVVFHVNGVRTLREIARVTGLDELTVCQLVCELQDMGVLEEELRAPGQATQDQLRRVVVRPKARGLSLFNRGSAPTGQAALVLRQAKGSANLADLAEACHLERATFLAAVRQLVEGGHLEVTEGADRLAELR